MSGGRIIALLVSSVVLVALLAVASRESGINYKGNHRESILLDVANKEAALERLQSLKAKITEDPSSEQSVPELRKQLLTLQANLESELKSVKLLLSGLEDKPNVQTRPNVEENVIDRESAKKSMQKGALHRDSVEVQLRKVLDDDLDKLIVHDTKWKSKKELDKAVDFASYLKNHPLEAKSHQPIQLRTASVAKVSQLAIKPVARLEVDGGGLVQAVDTAPEYFRDSGAVPNGVEGAEYALVRLLVCATPHHHSLTKLLFSARGRIHCDQQRRLSHGAGVPAGARTGRDGGAPPARRIHRDPLGRSLPTPHPPLLRLSSPGTTTPGAFSARMRCWSGAGLLGIFFVCSVGWSGAGLLGTGRRLRRARGCQAAFNPCPQPPACGHSATAR
jgi:hypothetical protein